MQVATNALRLALVIGLGVGCFATAGSAQRGSMQRMESGRRPSATTSTTQHMRQGRTARTTTGRTQRMAYGRRPSATVPGVRLSESQRTRVMHSRQQTQAQVRAIQRNHRLSAAEKQRRIAATHRRGHEQVMGHLTPRQRQQFSAAYKEHARVAGYRGKPHARTTTQQRRHQQRSTHRTHRSY